MLAAVTPATLPATVEQTKLQGNVAGYRHRTLIYTGWHLPTADGRDTLNASPSRAV